MSYADGVQCKTSDEPLPKLTVSTMAVSTYFDPYVYHFEQQLKLFN